MAFDEVSELGVPLLVGHIGLAIAVGLGEEGTGSESITLWDDGGLGQEEPDRDSTQAADRQGRENEE